MSSPAKVSDDDATGWIVVGIISISVNVLIFIGLVIMRMGANASHRNPNDPPSGRSCARFMISWASGQGAEEKVSLHSGRHGNKEILPSAV